MSDNKCPKCGQLLTETGCTNWRCPNLTKGLVRTADGLVQPADKQPERKRAMNNDPNDNSVNNAHPSWQLENSHGLDRKQPADKQPRPDLQYALRKMGMRAPLTDKEIDSQILYANKSHYCGIVRIEALRYGSVLAELRRLRKENERLKKMTENINDALGQRVIRQKVLEAELAEARAEVDKHRGKRVEPSVEYDRVKDELEADRKRLEVINSERDIVSKFAELCAARIRGDCSISYAAQAMGVSLADFKKLSKYYFDAQRDIDAAIDAAREGANTNDDDFNFEPCPKCGCVVIMWDSCLFDDFAECQNCLHRGPLAHNSEAARLAWNKAAASERGNE